ncbi:heterokaryon incompatibility protein-domain-containing protein [Apiospora marii]|uniref:heterokaryon incompatibility protein-domain-containing protein n=1 Tax=Apiospora marii TaxID=335849 RepID=UPI0031318E07
MTRERHNTADRQQQPTGGPIGALVRGIASGIGLASEIYQHRKHKEATEAGPHDRADNAATGIPKGRGHGNHAELPLPEDEAVWELDEAQDQVAGTSVEVTGTTEEEMANPADSFLQVHPRPSSVGMLALPVVITQRRPGSRVRGFVRAYSPLLENVGIDQSTFLDFLDKLNKSAEPSPWIQAINLASFAGQAVPEPFTIIISLAVKKAADATSELHSRFKTNRFLDQVNKSFFAPRGLVALVMTWKPSQNSDMVTTADFDMKASIAKTSSSTRQRRPFDSSSGATSFEWPETAPLVFLFSTRSWTPRGSPY